MKRKVLIMGTSGFIGRHLAPYLARNGYEVLGADRRSVEDQSFTHRVVDLLDAPALSKCVREFAPSVIVHLAARTDLDEKRDLRGYAANFDGTSNLIDAIQQTPSVKRVIYTSTQLVCRYGYVPRHDEDYSPDSLYGESKVRMERIVRQRDGGGVEWCLVRPTTVWGPGMGPHYRRFLRLLRKGRYFHIGRGPLLKSYSYIGNIVYQYKRLIEAPPEQIHRKTFYLSDYDMLSTRWYADELARALGGPKIPTYPVWLARVLAFAGDAIQLAGIKSFPFTSFRLRNILTEVRFDLRETEKVVGRLPFHAEEGVRRTAQWFIDFEKSDPAARRLGGDENAARSPL